MKSTRKVQESTRKVHERYKKGTSKVQERYIQERYKYLASYYGFYKFTCDYAIRQTIPTRITIQI